MISARSKTLLPLLLAIAFAAAACGDDPKPNTPPQDTPDVGMDAEPDAPEPDVPEPEPDVPEVPDLMLTEPQDGVDPEGAAISPDPMAGQVRAGVVRDGRGGHGGVQATCRPGCFVMVNAVARFCVEGRPTSSHLFFDGGRIIDAEPVGAPELPEADGRDRFDIVGTFIDLKTASAQSVEVIRDGTDGPLAVVRVTGVEEPSMFLAGILGPPLFRFRDFEIVTEYRLAADSPALEIVTFVTNRNGNRENVIPGDILFWGDTLRTYVPGQGQRLQGAIDGIFAHGPGVAYAWLLENPSFPTSIAGVDLPAIPLIEAGRALEDGQVLAMRRWMAVGTGVADLHTKLAAALPDHPSVAVGEDFEVSLVRSGAPLAGARIEIRPADGSDAVFQIDHTDPQGAARFRLPAGDVLVEVFGIDGDRATATADPASGTLELELPAMATIEINITDGDDQPSPAKVRLRGENNAERLVFVYRGELSATVPPGTWQWEASRGGEYTIVGGEVTVAGGESASIGGQLVRVVPTPGLVSGEFHQHSTASLDSEVPVWDRILSNIAEGVDFAVSSDHDVATDFAPLIEARGAGDLIASLPGTEVSPLFGHFGAYPIELDVDKPGRGAMPLAFKDDAGDVQAYQNAQQLIAGIRENTDARLVQSNHPRDSTGYFDTVGWTKGEPPPEEGQRGFSLDFDTMEVVNGPLCDQLIDYYGLLNAGKRIVGVGNSDSHSVGRPVGYPRNYFPAGTDDPAALTQDMIVDGVLSGDVVISAVAVLEFGGDPADPASIRPGRLIEATSATVDVRALTPPWAEVTSLFVLRNGVVVEELTIGAGDGEIVDFDGPLTLDAGGDRDAWFQIIVSTPDRLQSVYPGQRVYAMSNAFYLDANGNGEFDAPGPVVVDPQTIVFCR